MGNGCAEEYWKERALKAENELASRKVVEEVKCCKSCKYNYLEQKYSYNICTDCKYFGIKIDNWRPINE